MGSATKAETSSFYLPIADWTGALVEPPVLRSVESYA